ncbi:hypothetical protein BDN72DRAFT_929690 [Pluteus cervinus]|uniref:Uncharacterized protein n=1 Tax=Pluteus cervinus TaxID=181527 RepID=A0ACD3AB62_9AGAR|nr:hypothetical protein BDN72DRAFT_929690 [Pluteus cervinus]
MMGRGGGDEGHRGPTDARRVAALVPIDLATSKTPRDTFWESSSVLGGVEWGWCIVGGGGDNEGHQGPTNERRVAAFIPIDLQTSKTPRNEFWGSPNKVGDVGCGWYMVGERVKVKATEGQRISAKSCQMMSGGLQTRWFEWGVVAGGGGGREGHRGPADEPQVMGLIPIDYSTLKPLGNELYEPPNEMNGVGHGWCIVGGGGGSEAHRRPTVERRVMVLIPVDSSTQKTPRKRL